MMMAGDGDGDGDGYAPSDDRSGMLQVVVAGAPAG
jgi:hypothetical protein